MARTFRLALVVVLAAWSSAPAGAAEEETFRVGEPTPPFALRVSNPERAGLAGLKMFAPARFVGASPEDPKSAVVLSFAASYCEPCKKELAQLGALEPRLAKAKVALAVIVVDTDPDKAEEMLKLTNETLKLPYPVLLDRYGVVARRYRATALPYTVVIDKAGNVDWIHAGFQDGALDELMKKLGH